MLADHGLELTELSTHIQGQLLAVHPAYDQQFDAFAPAHVRGNPKARTEWAESQLLMAAKASRRLGLDVSVSFSGSLAFPYLYPWPQRPEGLIEEAFDELARRWKPVMDAYDNEGVDIAFELHPSEDLFDGVTFEMLLERLNNHPRCMINYDPSHFLLQQLDYLAFIDIYHERISAFHVKDAEFLPSGRQGVYSGYQPWLKRAGRFRSLGDGQVDFKSIFSKMAEYGYDGWAVLEWECCLKDAAVGAAEGAPFISNHIIEVTDKAFDDFAGTGMDRQGIHKMLGL
jgi:sugar phosphate isomerase/epimerase